jgi:hypothetical protein
LHGKDPIPVNFFTFEVSPHEYIINQCGWKTKIGVGVYWYVCLFGLLKIYLLAAWMQQSQKLEPQHTFEGKHGSHMVTKARGHALSKESAWRNIHFQRVIITKFTIS